MNVPRYMTPGGIFEAYREKQIILWTRLDIPVADGDIGLKGSPTRVTKTFPKQMKQPGIKIETGVEESVQFAMDKLKEKYLL